MGHHLERQALLDFHQVIHEVRQQDGAQRHDDPADHWLMLHLIVALQYQEEPDDEMLNCLQDVLSVLHAGFAIRHS